MYKKFLIPLLAISMSLTPMTITTVRAEEADEVVESAEYDDMDEDIIIDEDNKMEKDPTSQNVEEVEDVVTSNPEEESTDNPQEESTDNPQEEAQPTQPAEETTGTETEPKNDKILEKVVHSSDTKWEIDHDSEEPTTYKIFEVYVSEDTQKFEIFYSKDVAPPEVIIESARGDKYIKGNDVVTGDMRFISRTGLICTGYPDIMYDTIYLSNIKDPGTWKIQIEISTQVKEFIFVQAAYPSDWETLNVEYKTAVTDVIAWYMYTGDQPGKTYSKYTSGNILPPEGGGIADEEARPPMNDVEPAEEPTEEKIQIDPILIGLIGLIILIIVVTIILFKKLKNNEEQRREQIHKNNQNTNTKLAQKKKHDNDTLDNELKKYEDEYKDEEDDEDIDNNDYSDPDEDNLDDLFEEGDEPKKSKKSKKPKNRKKKEVIEDTTEDIDTSEYRDIDEDEDFGQNEDIDEDNPAQGMYEDEPQPNNPMGEPPYYYPQQGQYGQMMYANGYPTMPPQQMPQMPPQMTQVPPQMSPQMIQQMMAQMPPQMLQQMMTQISTGQMPNMQYPPMQPTQAEEPVMKQENIPETSVNEQTIKDNTDAKEPVKNSKPQKPDQQVPRWADKSVKKKDAPNWAKKDNTGQKSFF